MLPGATKQKSMWQQCRLAGGGGRGMLARYNNGVGSPVASGAAAVAILQPEIEKMEMCFASVEGLERAARPGQLLLALFSSR